MIIILNSFHKKLVNNEGIALEDDLYREINMKANHKIRKILKETKEVRQTISILEQNRPTYDNNRLVGYLTFLHKADLLPNSLLNDCIR